jgi:hypothetical protein
LICHGPYRFEEIDWEFREGEKFHGRRTGEVACRGFIGGDEEGIVVGLVQRDICNMKDRNEVRREKIRFSCIYLLAKIY